MVPNIIIIYIMITFGKMLTCFQMKNNNNTFMVSYIYNDKAPIISLWIQSGCGQIALMLWSNRTGRAIWCLGDLTCEQ